MISYGKQSLDKNDIEAVTKVLEGDWLTQGQAVDNFETDLLNYFGAKYTCAVTNGTAALHLAGLALDWRPGDIVITSPLTFLATANCIVYTGAIPDFVDINPFSFTIDTNLVEEKVKKYQSKGRKVKAIIGVDYAGHPCDWKGLRQIANKHDIQLINDNCHALGATYFDDKQYAVKYADVVTQSFHPVKHITTGEGGAILTNHFDIDDKVRLLRTHGMIKDQNKLKKNEEPWYYEMHQIGYNFRITDFQCALGSSQLKKLDLFVKKRREIAKKYEIAFINKIFLTIPSNSDNINSSHHLYPLQIDFNQARLSKLMFFKKMKESGVNLQVHYIPIHLQPFYKKNYKFRAGDFPISENFYTNEVSLPIYPDLSHNDVSMITKKIMEILSQ